MTRRQEAVKALSKLGRSEASVVRTLKELGIKGESSVSSCPIAQYLKQATGCGYVSVNRYSILVGDSCHSEEYDYIETRIPLAKFIDSFDDSKYPELVSR